MAETPTATTIYTANGRIIIGLREPEDIRSKVGIDVRCCQCKGCYKTIFTISIYDESHWNYFPQPDDSDSWPTQNYRDYRNFYKEDKERWEGYVDNYRCNEEIYIRMGLLWPVVNYIISGTEEASTDYCRHPDYDWPYDTTEDPIVIYEAEGEEGYIRVGTDDIIAIFDEMNSTFPDEHPELLIFTLDDSGSINVFDYITQLNEAKEYFRETYPDMVILDDISTRDERWIRDAANGVANRLCKYRCLCEMCRGPRPEQINIGVPTLPGMYPNATFSGTFLATPYGESSENECTWRNINQALYVSEESIDQWGFPTTVYTYYYVIITGTITRSYDEETDKYTFTHRVVIEMNEGSTYQEYIFEDSLEQSTQYLDCDIYKTLPLVTPSLEGSVTWNPG